MHGTHKHREGGRGGARPHPAAELAESAASGAGADGAVTLAPRTPRLRASAHGATPDWLLERALFRPGSLAGPVCHEHGGCLESS